MRSESVEWVSADASMPQVEPILPTRDRVDEIARFNCSQNCGKEIGRGSFEVGEVGGAVRVGLCLPSWKGLQCTALKQPLKRRESRITTAYIYISSSSELDRRVSGCLHGREQTSEQRGGEDSSFRAPRQLPPASLGMPSCGQRRYETNQKAYAIFGRYFDRTLPRQRL